MPEKTGLELLREPFLEHQIGKLPKPTKAQTAEVKADFKKGIRCKVCGGWHHKDVIHLDYIGHASLTDRLLDADPLWTWEPFAITEEGLPAFDKSGGLWIKLTVCGHTRIGYGHAEASTYKEIGSREKEVIGDALRNAAMRFGAALDLWHKGILHGDEDTEDEKKPAKKEPTKNIPIVKEPIKNSEQAQGVVDKVTLERQLWEAMDTLTDEKKKEFFLWLTQKYEGKGVQELTMMLKDIAETKVEFLGEQDVPDF